VTVLVVGLLRLLRFLVPGRSVSQSDGRQIDLLGLRLVDLGNGQWTTREFVCRRTVVGFSTVFVSVFVLSEKA
jgi:hypothetical protein